MKYGCDCCLSTAKSLQCGCNQCCMSFKFGRANFNCWGRQVGLNIDVHRVGKSEKNVRQADFSLQSVDLQNQMYCRCDTNWTEVLQELFLCLNT